MGDVIDWSKYADIKNRKHIQRIYDEVAPHLLEYFKSLPPERDARYSIVALCTWVCTVISETYPKEEWEEMGRVYGDYLSVYLMATLHED